MGKKYYIKREYVRLPKHHGSCLVISYYKDRAHTVLHRDNGPAVFCPGFPIERWVKNNELHREDGPAVIKNRSKEYWLNGEELKEEDFIFRQCMLKGLKT